MRFRPFTKRKLCDAGFIEFPEASGPHPIVLRLGGLRERQDKSCSAAKAKSDAGIFCGVRR